MIPTRDEYLKKIREKANGAWCGNPNDFDANLLQRVMNDFNEAKGNIRYLLAEIERLEEQVKIFMISEVNEVLQSRSKEKI